METLTRVGTEMKIIRSGARLAIKGERGYLLGSGGERTTRTIKAESGLRLPAQPLSRVIGGMTAVLQAQIRGRARFEFLLRKRSAATEREEERFLDR